MAGPHFFILCNKGSILPGDIRSARSEIPDLRFHCPRIPGPVGIPLPFDGNRGYDEGGHTEKLFHSGQCRQDDISGESNLVPFQMNIFEKNAVAHKEG